MIRKSPLWLLVAVLSLAIVGFPAAPAQAGTADPNSLVAGANTKWFSGGLLSMWGLNCTIIGGSYNEIMIQAYGQYGGAPSLGAPKVNETFYAVVNLSEPGWPCGSGISVPELRLRLPANTQLAIDAQHPIRCFVTPRFQSVYDETTNAGNWTIQGINGPISGPWCRPNPIQVDQSTWSIGTPAMANGTMHKVFVPIRSTTAQSNTALQWEVRDPSTYEGVQVSESRLWVFTQASSSPYFFFPDKAVNPFWDPQGAAGTQNRAEFFMNLYTGGQAGTICFEVRQVGTNVLTWRCDFDPGFNGAVGAGLGVVQLIPGSPGPTGGYVPFSFDPPEYDKDYTVRWTFKNGATILAESDAIPFHSLAGPDGDGDGVVDSADQCPTVKGTKANNGCPPVLPPDNDGDGLVGVADKCPDQNGQGSADGCPPPAGTPATTPTPAPTAPVIQTTKTVKVPKKLRKAKALKSRTPAVCRVKGKGTKARIVVRKPGVCKLTAKKGKKTLRAKLRVK